MTPDAAIREAKKNALRPIYVVVGDEQVLRDEVVASLREAALGGGVAAFNEDRFTAGEVDVEKIIGAARTAPMMAPRRFVLVRGIDRWDAQGGEEGSDDKKASPIERIAAYATAPIDSTCVVLVGTKIDGRRKLATVAKKGGFVVACDPLGRRELPEWIMQRCEARGNAIDPTTADLLAEIAGPGLAHVSDAIERLALFSGVGNPITEDAVTACVARVRTQDTWAVVGAVGERNLKKAFAALADAYDPRDRGLPMLGALAWSIRQLAKYQLAVRGGASSEEAAKRAGVFQPFRARELAQRSKQFQGKELERWLVVLAETDLALKSSRRPADSILEDMLTRLCSSS